MRERFSGSCPAVPFAASFVYNTVVLESLGSLLQNGITLVAMGALLARFGLWLPVALLVSTLPAFFAVLRTSTGVPRLAPRPHPRRAPHLVPATGSSPPERSAPNSASSRSAITFGEAYRSLRAGLRAERLRLARRQGLAEMGAGASALAVTGASMVWMAWRRVRGLATLGELALFYQAFQQGLSLMRGMLENAGQLLFRCPVSGQPVRIPGAGTAVHGPARPLAQDLSDNRLAGESAARSPAGQRAGFTHVTFRYPGSDRLALDDFTPRYRPPGRITAIVGPNGAQEHSDQAAVPVLRSGGRASGTERTRNCASATGGACAAVHHRPLPGAGALQRDSGARHRAGRPRRRTRAAEAIEDAARAAGADDAIGRLPKGLDSLLGRIVRRRSRAEHGRMAEVALARAFLRRRRSSCSTSPPAPWTRGPKPTGSKRFRRLAEGRTALIITHRFSTARFADIIHVMDAGRILESGSHDQLIALGGRYAAVWLAPRQG